MPELKDLTIDQLDLELDEATDRVNEIIVELRKRQEYVYYRAVKSSRDLDYAPTIQVFFERMTYRRVYKKAKQ